MAKQILIFKTATINRPERMDENLSLDFWSPSLSSVIPPGKGLKYLVLSFYWFSGLMKNKSYYQVNSKVGDKKVGSFLLIPKFYKWPFMDIKDLQFAYVMIDKDFRGRGIAWQSIYEAQRILFPNQQVNFWYVTDTSNKGSIKLAKKMGFELTGFGKNKSYLGGVIKQLKIQID